MRALHEPSPGQNDVAGRATRVPGFAIQLCLMRYPGPPLLPNEIPPGATLNYITDQIGADPRLFEFYARLDETRRDHIAHLLRFLELTRATSQDRCVALLAAIEAAETTWI